MARPNPVNPTVGRRLAERVLESIDDRLISELESELMDYELSGDDFWEACAQVLTSLGELLVSRNAGNCP